jgi:hypothetical protein
MDARTTARPFCFNNEGGRIAIQAAEYHVHGNNTVKYETLPQNDNSVYGR